MGLVRAGTGSRGSVWLTWRAADGEGAGGGGDDLEVLFAPSPRLTLVR